MVTAVLLVGAVYISSSPYPVVVEGVSFILGTILCSPQENGKTYCCASVNEGGQTETTYCTTCDNTNPPSNCTEREKPLVVNPGRDLSNVLENSLLEEPTTLPNLNQSVSPRWGEVLQTENNLTFSQANISSNNTMPLQQSDLVLSDTLENSTKTVTDAGEQIEDKSATTKEETAQETDDGKEQDNDEDENGNEDEDKNDEESTTSQ